MKIAGFSTKRSSFLLAASVLAATAPGRCHGGFLRGSSAAGGGNDDQRRDPPLQDGDSRHLHWNWYSPRQLAEDSSDISVGVWRDNDRRQLSSDSGGYVPVIGRHLERMDIGNIDNGEKEGNRDLINEGVWWDNNRRQLSSDTEGYVPVIGRKLERTGISNGDNDVMEGDRDLLLLKRDLGEAQSAIRPWVEATTTSAWRIAS